jgi:cytoskeletal protein CcmA (bactofilin family)
MLQKNAPMPSPQESSLELAPETIIGAGVHIQGDIRGDSKMELRGTVDGNVALEGQLVIADGGKVIGDVSATSVLVDGEVRGNVRATDKVQLSSSAKLIGNLEADRISIQEGALFQGRVDELSTDGGRQDRQAAAEEELRQPVYG